MKRLALLALPLIVVAMMIVMGFDAPTARALRTAWRGPHFQGSAFNNVRLYYSQHQDESLYYEYASLMMGGGPPSRTHYAPLVQLYHPAVPGSPALPYRDFHAEYPPLAFAFQLLPRLFTESPERYGTLFALEMVLFLYLAIVVARRVRRRFGDPVTASSLACYGAAALFLIGQLSIDRFDLIPATLVLLAFEACLAGRPIHSSLWIAAGTLTKIYPLIMLPIPVLAAWRRHGLKMSIATAALPVAVIVAVSLPFYRMNPAGFLGMFAHHTERGLEIGSLYAWVLHLANFFDPGLITVTQRSISDVVIGPAAARLVPLTLPFLCATVASLQLWLLLKRRLRETEPFWYWGFVLLTAAFIVPAPIGSPQFVLWFLPLVLAAPGESGRRLRIAFLLYAAATQVQFDGTFYWLRRLSPIGTAGLTLRWIACLAFVGIAVRAARAKRILCKSPSTALPALSTPCDVHSVRLGRPRTGAL